MSTKGANMSASRDTSSSRRIPKELTKRQRSIHAKLLQSLEDEMTSERVMRMNEYLRASGSLPTIYSNLNRVHDIIDNLERREEVIIGNKDGYKLLIEAFKTIKESALATTVEEYQFQIFNAGREESRKADGQDELATGEQPEKRRSHESRDKPAADDEMSSTGSDEATLKIRTIAWGLLLVVVIFAIVIGMIPSKAEEYQRELAAKESDCKRLKEELDTSKKEIEKLKDQCREQQTILDSNNETIAGLTTDKEQLTRQVEEYQRKLTGKENDGKRLQEGLGTSKKEIEKLKGEEGVQLAKGPRNIEHCQEVFKKEYGTSIFCIVNLGDRFAVAYGPARDDIEGVDIYDMISGVKQTLEDNIEGLSSLAVTPDKGTLVAICDEGYHGPYTIRIWDHVSGGYKTSTQFNLDGGVWRFDVCDGRQFVIIHRGRDKVSVVYDMYDDGSAVHTEEVQVKAYPNYISCGGRYVYLARGQHYVDVHEITENHHLNYIASQRFDEVRDVSATAAGEVTVTCKRGGRWCFGRSTFKNNKFSEWKYKDVESRPQHLVSVGGDHVVVAGCDNSNDVRILRVFKEEV